MSLRLAWSTEEVPGQPGIHRDSCLEKKAKEKRKKKEQRTKKMDSLVNSTEMYKGQTFDIA